MYQTLNNLFEIRSTAKQNKSLFALIKLFKRKYIYQEN